MVNNLKTTALMALLGGLLVAAGYAYGGQSSAIIMLFVAALLNMGMYFFSDKIALKSSRAQPVTQEELPEVYSIVGNLAMAQNMPMPRIYVIDAPQPNAFATGRNPKNAAVAVTRGILQMMTRSELEGVLAHELSHVANRDILISSIAATVGAAISFLSRIAFWGGGRGRDRNVNPLISIAALILAPLAAVIIQMAISRSREFQADRSGAEMTGQPLALASALAKLGQGTARIPMDVNPAVSSLFIADPMKALGGRGRGRGRFGKMFSTHPPMEQRIERLQAMSSGIR
jgi:heat shock protein HtpX